MPLWTKVTFPTLCGWALTSFGIPCVAHLVWPIPIFELILISFKESSSLEILPWDFISIGVSKKFFINEMEKALKEQITLNCRTECAMCGAKSFGGGVCYEVQN